MENQRAKMEFSNRNQRQHSIEGCYHYHMAIKLDRVKRWLSVRKLIESENGIRVNFSEHHSNYYGAWQYVTKDDKEFIESEDHPDLSDGHVPKTTAATVAKRKSGENKENSMTTVKKKRFDVLDLADVIVRNKIKSKAQLLNLVKLH